jgi:hypothetical protein
VQRAEPQVFRPSAGAYRRTLLASLPAGAVALLGVLAGGAKLPGQARWWFIGFWALLIPAVVIFRVRYSRRASVEVNTLSVVITEAVRHRVIPRDDLGLVLPVAGISALPSPSSPTGAVYLLDRSRRRRLALYDVIWGQETLTSFAACLGLPVTHLARATFTDLAARYPGSVPWPVAHPRRLAGVIIALIVLAAIVAAALNS